ncbi:MAG: EI24 domain-containing protein [Flavobacteriales bacterium]|jgi:CysZ protein|nr:EI24 domain-containing protein [Flavobacteriales bacterium]MBK7942157.1 EI24 domain-containing protein [Flavobacteriales bacterium]MBK8949635.1 EI24 domain-containing protein [Flavobacteriales bacterium]MBK9700698.1 EI24 domain-containing protein [Flavobacteriales bacterium]
MDGFGNGFSSFVEAFGFMRRHRMTWMFLVPLLLWALLTFGLFALLQGPVEELGAWLASQLGLQVDPAQDTGWWAALKRVFNATREALTWLALKLLVLYLLLSLNKYLVLILLSPLLAYASERAEELLTGAEHPFSLAQVLRDALRGAAIALRNGVLELTIGLAIGLLSLVMPLFVPLATLALFIVGAYFYGFSAVDYILERRRLRLADSVRTVNAHLGLVLGNGTAFSLLMKVPLLGTTFAPLLAAVGAVLAFHHAGRMAPNDRR